GYTPPGYGYTHSSSTITTSPTQTGTTSQRSQYDFNNLIKNASLPTKLVVGVIVMLLVILIIWRFIV
ncbi:MAG: hypothetical protein P4L61_00905, partial [Candidatus Pacebacteria bacterium]|nr:hypothetical protein [Candidatus Paceibacterota bacterium]